MKVSISEWESMTEVEQLKSELRDNINKTKPKPDKPKEYEELICECPMTGTIEIMKRQL